MHNPYDAKNKVIRVPRFFHLFFALYINFSHIGAIFAALILNAKGKKTLHSRGLNTHFRDSLTLSFLTHWNDQLVEDSHYGETACCSSGGSFLIFSCFARNLYGYAGNPFGWKCIEKRLVTIISRTASLC